VLGVLCRVAEHYEVMIYTASLAKYADPLLDKLDMHKVGASYSLSILGSFSMSNIGTYWAVCVCAAGY
jgi:hypothetical protein